MYTKSSIFIHPPLPSPTPPEVMMEADALEAIRSQYHDLSWVTFTEKDPEEPCEHLECVKDLGQAAEWVIETDCGHKYYMCETHRVWILREQRVAFGIYCSKCGEDIIDFTVEPLKRG